MKKQRKHYTPQENVAILRRHFVEGMPQIGSGEGTAEESPPECRVTDETDYFRLADQP
jgi:hypothetical protein